MLQTSEPDWGKTKSKYTIHNHIYKSCNDIILITFPTPFHDVKNDDLIVKRRCVVIDVHDSDGQCDVITEPSRVDYCQCDVVQTGPGLSVHPLGSGQFSSVRVESKVARISTCWSDNTRNRITKIKDRKFHLSNTSIPASTPTLLKNLTNFLECHSKRCNFCHNKDDTKSYRSVD